MNFLIALTQADAAGGQVAEIARTFGVDWPHLMAQTISFSIVCVMLYLLAYTPILRMLEARRRQIAQGLANAAKIEAELARTRAAREDVLRHAHEEATKFIEGARDAAARIRAEEVHKAIAASDQILIDAREVVARDRARMLRELKREMGRLVVRTSSVVTGKILTPDDERRLFEETARQLAA